MTEGNYIQNLGIALAVDLTKKLGFTMHVILDQRQDGV
jgi:hypothetical protein